MDKMKVKEALEQIVANSEAPALNWCVNYAKYALTMLASQASEADIRTQLLYVLSNMTHWRGPIARSVRAVLKEATKR